MTQKIPTTRIKVWTIVGIILSWLTIWIFILSPIGLAVWVGILLYLVVNKANLKGYLLLSAWIFIPCFNFLTGTMHYFRGTATLKSIGGPNTYHGIDRETRVPDTSSGCIVVGYEPFVFSANNFAVRTWTNLLGYQRGAYTGSFPTKDEAKRILENGDTITVERRDRFFQFTTRNRMVKLDTTSLDKFYFHQPKFDKIIGDIVDGECFVFQQIGVDETRFEKMIFLVDIKKDWVITQYVDY